MRSTTDVVPAIYKPGERFAQLVLVQIPEYTIVEAAELSETDRGEGGFGSTGNTTEAPAEMDSVEPAEAA
jgi:dUTPase